MELHKIFDAKFHALLQTNIQNVLLDKSDSPPEPAHEPTPPKDPSNSFGCSYCQVQFADIAQQRDHYKLDWHRYNLKQSLSSRLPISEEEFLEKNAKDDVSSISGSDSETDTSSDSHATAQGKIFLQTSTSQIFSIYTCLLLAKKEEISNAELCKRLETICKTNRKWTVLMLGGGHFAGAVFDGDKPVLHKTFHTYTVRAGQGGAQSTRDGKSSGIKSAGASLRRYNEQALVQHVRAILEAWKEEIEGSSLVLYRATGPHNRAALFGTSILEKKDARLRTIPFSTRRATFAEVKRVHSVLTLAEVYGSLDEAMKCLKDRLPEQKKKTVDRAKSRERVERELPVVSPESSSSEEGEVELLDDLANVSFEDLKEFDDSLTPEQRQNSAHKRKNRGKKKSKSKRLQEQEAKRKGQVIQALVEGKVDNLCEIFASYDDLKKGTDYINEALDEEDNTLLHLAAMNEHVEMLDYLLQNGANPCLKNTKQMTAYTITKSGDVREFFKQFARENPDKFNYNKAQIPLNVLTAEEIAAKKKAIRKVKKEKEKVKRKEQEERKREEADKERFMKLSDREKRALAAERRIVDQCGQVISRCFLCASDMSGKVPFEYMGNKFCTIDCLKAHRMQRPLILS